MDLAAYAGEHPGGHPFLHREGDVDYIYYCSPYPLVRVPADPEALADPEAGRRSPAWSRARGSTSRSSTAARTAACATAGRRKTQLVSQEQQAKLDRPRAGSRSDETLLNLRDVVTGKTRAGPRRLGLLERLPPPLGDDRRGDRWAARSWARSGIAEADAPLGPWVYARKIVTHDDYSFYNPKQHPLFDQEGGRIIYFEGTYTTTFSGNKDPDPEVRLQPGDVPARPGRPPPRASGGGSCGPAAVLVVPAGARSANGRCTGPRARSRSSPRIARARDRPDRGATRRAGWPGPPRRLPAMPGDRREQARRAAALLRDSRRRREAAGGNGPALRVPAASRARTLLLAGRGPQARLPASARAAGPGLEEPESADDLVTGRTQEPRRWMEPAPRSLIPRRRRTARLAADAVDEQRGRGRDRTRTRRPRFDDLVAQLEQDPGRMPGVPSTAWSRSTRRRGSGSSRGWPPAARGPGVAGLLDLLASPATSHADGGPIALGEPDGRRAATSRRRRPGAPWTIAGERAGRAAELQSRGSARRPDLVRPRLVHCLVTAVDGAGRGVDRASASRDGRRTHGRLPLRRGARRASMRSARSRRNPPRRAGCSARSRPRREGLAVEDAPELALGLLAGSFMLNAESTAGRGGAMARADPRAGTSSLDRCRRPAATGLSSR